MTEKPVDESGETMIGGRSIMQDMTIGAHRRQREAPWIGIGVQGKWQDYRSAMQAAELDFNVEARPAKVEIVDPYGTGFGTSIVNYTDVPGVQVNVCSDDQRILGCVSKQYGIVQNEQAFSLLEPFTDAGGVITNAGMTEQGLAFMVLRIRQQMIAGDDWDFDVMCTNSFNGAFPCALMMVPTRIICQNMYRSLMGGRADSLLHVRHGSLADKKISAAKSVTGNVLRYITAFSMELGVLASSRMMKDKLENDLLPMLFPYPKPGGDREQMSRERIDRLREEFLDVFYDAPDNRKFHGSGLGFVNAYYDYLSHRNPTKNMPGLWEHRRLSGLVSGNDVKYKVIKAARA